MRALVQLGYGSPGSVALRQVPDPVHRAGDLLVRVHAAGLNAADRLLLRGEPFAIRVAGGGWRRPRGGFVVGRALAGRVEAVGDDVRSRSPGATAGGARGDGVQASASGEAGAGSGWGGGVQASTRGDAGPGLARGDAGPAFVVGDDVLAEVGGAIGELVRVPARLAAPKPEGLSFSEAAALPLAGTTALQAVRDAVAVRPGQRLLVTGASGGVGTFAVQLAAAMGATVTAVCAGRNAGLMRTLGADRVIDYQHTGVDDALATPGEGFDAILDLAGNYPVATLRRALAPGGTLVLSVGTGGRWLGPARRILRGVVIGGRRVRPFTARPSREDLAELATMAATGRIRPVIDQTYPFEQAAAAVEHLDRGPVTGKIVITVSGFPA